MTKTLYGALAFTRALVEEPASGSSPVRHSQYCCGFEWNLTKQNVYADSQKEFLRLLLLLPWTHTVSSADALNISVSARPTQARPNGTLPILSLGQSETAIDT
jgi:hypothetical protein